MGWKVSSVFINSGTNARHEDILQMLGFKNFKNIGAELFEKAMYPEPGKVFIGAYKNNLVITAAGLPESFFKTSLSNIESKLIEAFPRSEIGAVLLQCKVNHYGFALIKNGKKIRIKTGDADNENTIDYGPPLEQELELLSESTINEKGKRMYNLDDTQQQLHTEEQTGSHFVAGFFKRFTGKSLIGDAALLDTICTGYQLPGITFFTDAYFNGEWNGQYSYGEDYLHIDGSPEGFTTNIIVTNGELRGHFIEKKEGQDTSSTIHGFIADPFIGFVKKYTVINPADNNSGVKREQTNALSNTTYSGIYDLLTDTFKGIWKIKDSQQWGGWVMKRK